MTSGFAWECDECNHVDYGEYPPKDCPKCQALESFNKLSEEANEKREGEILREMRTESKEGETYLEDDNE